MGIRDLFRRKPLEPLSERVESDLIALSKRVDELEERCQAMVDEIETAKKRTVRMERFMYRHKVDFKPDEDEDQFKLPFDIGDTKWLKE